MSDHKPKIDIDSSLMDEAVKAVNDTKKDNSSEDSESNSETENSNPSSPGAEDFKDRWIRTTADFDNFRKRVQKEKSDMIKFGNESLIKELLPVMDNFERALATSPQSKNESMFQGVQMIYSQLKNILERFGLTSETSKGKPFDPNLHEAMSHKESRDVPPHTVVDEHQKMYFLHKKLIRPALVTVSKDDGSREAETIELSPDRE